MKLPAPRRSLFALLAVSLISAICLPTGEPTDPGPPSMYWLVGNWSAPAFDGRIVETWSTRDGRVHLKQGCYIVGLDTQYREEVTIDELSGAGYLLAKPQNAAFRVYDRTAFDQSSMVFESLLYKEPFRIRYDRIDNDHFDRTVSSLVEEDTVLRVFHFQRIPRSGP